MVSGLQWKIPPDELVINDDQEELLQHIMAGASPQLLVVDDEEFNLEIIAEYLDGTNYELEMASNGQDAWHLVVVGGASEVLQDRLRGSH